MERPMEITIVITEFMSLVNVSPLVDGMLSSITEIAVSIDIHSNHNIIYDHSRLVCTTASGLMDGLVGMLDEKICSFGAVVRVCNEIGHWKLTQNDCACAADGLWEQTELGETRQIQCGNGGLLRRTCMNSGYWDDEQNFNCSR